MTRFRFILPFIPTAATGAENEMTPLHKAATVGDAIRDRVAPGADMDATGRKGLGSPAESLINVDGVIDWGYRMSRVGRL